MSWTLCSCRHIAQDHNQQVPGWEIRAALGCSLCDCKSYDGHQVPPHPAKDYQILSTGPSRKIYVVCTPDNDNRPLNAYYSMTPEEQLGWEREGFEVCEVRLS